MEELIYRCEWVRDRQRTGRRTGDSDNAQEQQS